MTDAGPSLWRAQADSCFNLSDEGLERFASSQVIAESRGDPPAPSRIAVDTLFPLSFYVSEQGKCSLYSHGQGSFWPLGQIDLPFGASPNCVVHSGEWLLVANDRGVCRYTTNSAEVARGQNIDDFTQLSLTRQTQPASEIPAATFFSCDVKVADWP